MHSRSFENSAFQMHRVNASCLGVLGVSLTFDKPLTSSTKPAFRNGKALLILSLIKPQPAESCKSTRSHHLSLSLISLFRLPVCHVYSKLLASLDGLAHLSAPRLGSTGFPVAAFQLGSQHIVFIQFSTL